MASSTECPTGRYASEIVTASGLTLKNPTAVSGSVLDWSGSEQDFEAWDALAIVLIGRLELAWRELKSCPGAASMDVARYNGLVERLNTVREAYAAIRKPWHSEFSAKGTTGWTWGVSTPDFAFDASGDIGKTTGVIVDAQCLRQRIDEAIVELGCTPNMPGDTGHAPALGILGTIALGLGAVAIVGGTLLVARKVMK